jgi:hypothetical protein
MRKIFSTLLAIKNRDIKNPAQKVCPKVCPEILARKSLPGKLARKACPKPVSHHGKITIISTMAWAEYREKRCFLDRGACNALKAKTEILANLYNA